MKSKKVPVGQLLFESIGETDDSYEYVENLIPKIGEIVIFFNALEADVDQILCRYVSDRTDQKGLLILSNMMFLTKIELFERFSSELLRETDDKFLGYNELISNLKECGSLRNKVVHANWMYTNNDGYTQVKIKFGKQGLEHELVQFSIESMNQILTKIENTRASLDYFFMEYLSG